MRWMKTAVQVALLIAAIAAVVGHAAGREMPDAVAIRPTLANVAK